MSQGKTQARYLLDGSTISAAPLPQTRWEGSSCRYPPFPSAPHQLCIHHGVEPSSKNRPQLRATDAIDAVAQGSALRATLVLARRADDMSKTGTEKGSATKTDLSHFLNPATLLFIGARRAAEKRDWPAPLKRTAKFTAAILLW